MWAYIYGRPEYFANQLDQICYFNWRVRNLNKPAKYVKKIRKCFFHYVINRYSLIVWFEPANDKKQSAQAWPQTMLSYQSNYKKSYTKDSSTENIFFWNKSLSSILY